MPNEGNVKMHAIFNLQDLIVSSGTLQPHVI